MFSKPKTTTFVAPAEPIDANEKYIVRLNEIKDEGVSKFADPADADPAHNLRWVFGLYHLDKTPVLNIDDEVYEHHDYSSNRTGKSKTQTARARLWIEALLGRPVEDNEINDNLPDLLKDKTAVCLFEEKVVERDDMESYTKLKILRLSPYKSPQMVKEEALELGATPRMAGAAMASATKAAAKGKDLPF